jgi:hypothetical protein
MTSFLECGTEILIAVRENKDFALLCLKWLISRQDADEIESGTSLRKNGRGLNKAHAAEFIHNKAINFSHESLCRVVSSYAHTQLPKGVMNGELQIPKRSADAVMCKRRRKLISDETESDDEEVDEEVVVDEEVEVNVDVDVEVDVEDEKEITVDEYGVHSSGIFFPNRRFCDRVAKIMQRVRENASSSVWIHKEVRRIINEEDMWMGFDVDMSVVDAALYFAMTPINFTNEPPKWIRIFWASESRWVTARVDRVSVSRGASICVHLYFPDEDAQGSVAGPDAMFAYEVRFGAA